jgi:hypothetical protein
LVEGSKGQRRYPLVERLAHTLESSSSMLSQGGASFPKLGIRKFRNALHLDAAGGKPLAIRGVLTKEAVEAGEAPTPGPPGPAHEPLPLAWRLQYLFEGVDAWFIRTVWCLELRGNAPARLVGAPLPAAMLACLGCDF